MQRSLAHIILLVWVGSGLQQQAGALRRVIRIIAHLHVTFAAGFSPDGHREGRPGAVDALVYQDFGVFQ